MDPSLSSTGIASLIPAKISSGGEEFGTEIWYGTAFGNYGVIQFQNSGITHEVR